MTWISTIICSTLLIRTIVGIPVAIAQTKAMDRLVNLKPELQKLGEELKMETAIAIQKFNWDKKTVHRQFTKSVSTITTMYSFENMNKICIILIELNDILTIAKYCLFQYKKHWRQLVENNNCHPMKSLALSLTQLPFWICLSSALRNIVYAVPLPRTSGKARLREHKLTTEIPWGGKVN